MGSVEYKVCIMFNCSLSMVMPASKNVNLVDEIFVGRQCAVCGCRHGRETVSMFMNENMSLDRDMKEIENDYC
jgi:hypothetical protein